MVDIALLQSVSYIAGALGVCVAAFYYVMNLRISQRNQELTLKALEQSAKAQELTLQSQQQNLETRQAQLFMGIFQTTTTKEWVSTTEEMIHVWKWRDFEDYDAKYGELTNIEATGKLNSVLGYWNGVGVLVKRGLIDSDLIYDMKRLTVIELWDKFSPIILEWRRRYSAPQIYVGIESLVDELRQIRVAKGDGVYVERSKVKEKSSAQ